jgi:hypothetical protein
MRAPDRPKVAGAFEHYSGTGAIGQGAVEARVRWGSAHRTGNAGW